MERLYGTGDAVAHKSLHSELIVFRTFFSVLVDLSRCEMGGVAIYRRALLIAVNNRIQLIPSLVAQSVNFKFPVECKRPVFSTARCLDLLRTNSSDWSLESALRSYSPHVVRSLANVSSSGSGAVDCSCAIASAFRPSSVSRTSKLSFAFNCGLPG